MVFTRKKGTRWHDFNTVIRTLCALFLLTIRVEDVCMLVSVYYLLAAEDSVSFLATDTVELSL